MKIVRYEECLCAYDSSSSSDDNDESPRNKKQKVSLTEVDGDNGRGLAVNIQQREDKLLKPSIKPSNARGTLATNASASKPIPSLSTLNYHSGLSDRFAGGDHHTRSQAGNQNKKTAPSFIGSVTRKTHTKSSISGSSVKPYVSKREREKIVQENASITASTISTNHQLEEIGCQNSMKGVQSELRLNLQALKLHAQILYADHQKTTSSS